MVPMARPDMMLTAMEPYIGSPISGAIPRMVVSEAIITGVVIGGMNDPKSLVKLGIALVAIAAVCFVVYLIAPGTEAKGLLVEQPGKGTLKLTDTVLYLAYLLAIAAAVSIVVGEVRVAITNRKG